MEIAQTIICRCGAQVAACVEPDCYTDREWTTALREYVNSGYSVKLINTNNVKLQRCKC